MTQDYGLASILLPKSVSVISPRGRMYTTENIDQLLFERYLGAKLRRAAIHTKGPKKFTVEDRKNFFNSFEKILSNFEGDLNYL
ncbi:MAG: hypothetical protein K0S34_1379 [Bacillales bacterium]|nr:hypothetical protein [Bacillales bacterium]